MAGLGDPWEFPFYSTWGTRLLRFVQMKEAAREWVGGAREKAGDADKRPGRVVAQTREVVGGREK